MSTGGKHKKSLVPPGVGNTLASSTSSRRGTTVTGQSISKSKYGGHRNTIFSSTRAGVSSASRKSGGPASDKSAGHGIKIPVQIFDDGGNDVTPLPLLQLDPSALKKNQGNLLGDSSGGTPTDLMSQASMSIYAGTATASAFGGGPFSRSVFSQSYETGTESVDDIAEPTADMSSGWADIRHKREDVKEVLTPADLEKIVDLTLTETDTIWLLDMPGICVASDAEDATAIKDKNEKYKELIKSRVGNDLYAERGMNTFNEPPKLKLVQTTKISHNDVGVVASTWDMYDTYAEIERKKKGEDGKDDEEEGTISRPSSPKSGDGDREISDTQKSSDGRSLPRVPSSRLGSAGTVQGSRLSDSRATLSSQAGTESLFASKDVSMVSGPAEITVADEERVLKSDNLKRDLFVMERAVNLNTYQPKQALYRSLPIMQDIDREKSELSQISVPIVPDMGPSIDRLWSYTCPITKGHNVSCIAWNKVNPDLVAVGYSQFEFTGQKSGLICCWSLKNPEYPERVYNCKHGVTAVDFSNANPNLLAAGLYDGGVVIYNVRNTIDESVLDNFEYQGKHTNPVWQIRWIEKERGSGEEKAEVIVSISTDGRVTQWSIRKGFESHDLMRLKRMPTKHGSKGREKKGEAFISRFAGGLCFDFGRDSNIYLAGTEEGHIHKCSCSYNEQYLESYSGHMGPVYRIEWSPFVPDIFLSAGADWTVRLWHQDRTNPVLSFYSSTKSVHDISWSPRSSTVFACVNEGAVEVWDLAASTLDPVINSSPVSGAKQTAVAFAKNSECLLVGDSEGQVTVYQLRSMPSPPFEQAETLRGIINASLASQLQSSSAVDQNTTGPTNQTDFENME